MTPLEALALGTPVVASRIPCFEEALGDVVTFVDNEAIQPPRLPTVLVPALRQAIASAGDPHARQRRIEHAAPYTWEANARATLGVWQSLV